MKLFSNVASLKMFCLGALVLFITVFIPNKYVFLPNHRLVRSLLAYVTKTKVHCNETIYHLST